MQEISPHKLNIAVGEAVGLTASERADDILCPNRVQNILVISTPSESNAQRYRRMQALTFGRTEYEVSAYQAPPDESCKG